MRFCLLPLFLALTLAACSRRAQTSLEVIVLDSGGQGTAAAVRSATVEGLVGFDEGGRIIPALADRWTVTDDGQSYIFRLRDATWPDGAPLTAETGRAGLRRALAALRGTALAHELDAVDEVRAMAGRVIEIRLSRPMPEFLQLLAQPELGISRRGRGAGPMILRREGPAAILTPIRPDLRGLPAVKDWARQVRALRLADGTDKAAIGRFEENPAVVVLGGTFVHWPALADARVPQAAVRVDPVVGLFGLVVAHTDGFMAEAMNREAIAMAINREALARALGIPGWIGTSRIVFPTAEREGGLAAERWPGLSSEQRLTMARSRLIRWRERHGEVMLRIALPRGAGSDVLFAQLASDLVVAGFKPVRVGETDPAELRLLDAVARSSRPDWFLVQLSCKVRPQACSPAADAAYAAATSLRDPVARAGQIAQAEAELTAANTYIPFGPPLRWSLAAPNTSGFLPNRWAVHPLLALATSKAP